MSTKHTINSIQLLNNNILISFFSEWFQEDITTLMQLILVKIPNYQIKEHILGADRENIRFVWQKKEFLLNFDYYSQSCWIEGYDEASQLAIPTLVQLLQKTR